MKTKFVNAQIVTLDEKDTVLTDGELVTDGETIEYIGRNKYSAPCERTVDCEGDILMPALCNTHTHLSMTILRSIADDMPLFRWLDEKIFPLEKKMDKDIMRLSAYLGAAELVRGGTAAVADMYLDYGVVKEVLGTCGLYGVVAFGGSDADGRTQERLAQIREIFERDRAGRYVKPGLGFHAEYTCSETYLDGIADLVQQYKSGVYFHLSETLDEVGGCAKRHRDMSPPEYLYSLGLLDYGGVAAHCVHCDKDDLSVLAQNNVAVSLNPGSNLKLGSGIPPIGSMIAKNLLLTLGTDSAASNNKLDIWREMYLSAVLAKGTLNDASAMPARLALKTATQNGYRALGFCNAGVLKIGGDATLIRVDSCAQNFIPMGDLYASLVYASEASQVRLTMSHGKILYEDGAFFLGVDMAVVQKEAAAAAKRLGIAVGR